MLLAASVFTGGCTRRANPVQTLNVSGSTTILPIAEETGAAFQLTHADTKVLVSGLGSSAGIEAVSAGTAQIGTSSRELAPEEKKNGLVDHPIAYDGIAVIVSPQNPVTGLTMEQLRAIFAGKIKNWAEVGGPNAPIELVNRDDGSGTRDAFQKLVMGKAKFDPEATVLPGTGQVRDVVARAPRAIGYISEGFVEPRFTDVTVKALPIDGVAPSEKTIADKSYPIGRVLHFFTKGQPTGLTKEYIDYVLSPKVQKGVVVEAGFIPIAEGGTR